MKINQLPVFLLCMAAGVLQAQTAEVHPERYFGDERGGVSPVVTFTLNTDDTAIFPKNKFPDIIYPKLNNPGIAGFSFLHSSLTPAGHLPGESSLVYFTHLDGPQPEAWFDKNYNYNYTDDGPPVRCNESGMLRIELQDPLHAGRSMGFLFGLLKNKTHIDSAVAVIIAGSPMYAGTMPLKQEYWLEQQAQWMKGQDVVCGDDSLCVVFFDQNMNGCYTENGDMVCLYDYGKKDARSAQFTGTETIRPGLLLQHRRNIYELETDSTKCNTALLRRRTDVVMPHRLRTGDTLPHFYTTLLNGDSTDIYKVMQPGKYVLFDFWGIWCKGCVLQIPELKKIHQQYGDRLQLISCNAFDDREKLKTYVTQHDMIWTQIISDSRMRDLLYGNDSFPFGILIGPDRRIIAFDIGTKEALKQSGVKD